MPWLVSRQRRCSTVHLAIACRRYLTLMTNPSIILIIIVLAWFKSSLPRQLRSTSHPGHKVNSKSTAPISFFSRYTVRPSFWEGEIISARCDFDVVDFFDAQGMSLENITYPNKIWLVIKMEITRGYKTELKLNRSAE